jgi:uncharacterized protein with PIN domain
VLSDQELTVVSFDSQGLLKSMSTGVIVAVGAHEDDAGSVDDQIDAEQRRVLAQEAKLESLKAQEGRAAYEKVHGVFQSVAFLKRLSQLPQSLGARPEQTQS